MDRKTIPANDKGLTIGVFSQASGLSQKALRLYEQNGLLKPAYIDPENGYRYYHHDQLRLAHLILLMRQMDMPLSKIRRMLAVEPTVASNMAVTYAKQAAERAERTRSHLQSLLSCLQCPEEGKIPMSEMRAEFREIPPQLVLSCTRRIKIDGLEDHVRNTPKQLQTVAEASAGTVLGPSFNIFHGPVNQEDEGPVEVCLPVAGAFTPSGEIVLKELPGGTMSLVSGTGEYCDFPKVLQLYDEACLRMEQNGYTPAGPPREWLHGPNGEPDALTVVWPCQPKFK